MEAIILSVGNELITGRCVDTNAVWLSGKLTRRGVSVVRHTTVGDDERDIQSALEAAFCKSRLVITTGGLGPTPDDVTRTAIAAAISRPLEENAEALQQIRAMFDRWQRRMHDSNRIQALIPEGCTVIPNHRGTAPGFWFRGGEALLVALPGVPVEMKPMFEATADVLLPAESTTVGARSAFVQCFGMSEAKIGEVIKDLMARGRNPLVGTTASGGIINIQVLARAPDDSGAERLLAATVTEIRDRLGNAVFGGADDTIEGAVARLLAERGSTLSTAESCTGGRLAEKLTDLPGSSSYFLRGYVTYANDAKIDTLGVSPDLLERDGAVSEAVARAMATGCRDAADSDFALSITGIAGPGGGNPPEKPIGLVYLGLATREEATVKRLLLGEHLLRCEIRDRACKSALNLLRLHLIESAAK